MAKWLRFGGRPAPAALQGPATQTEPPQIRGLPVAQVQRQRTMACQIGESAAIVGTVSGDTQDGPLPINAARLLILSVGLARS